MQVQRVHRGRASVGTDVCVNGVVAVKVKHAIDRGGGGTQSTRQQEAQRDSHDMKGKERKGEEK